MNSLGRLCARHRWRIGCQLWLLIALMGTVACSDGGQRKKDDLPTSDYVPPGQTQRRVSVFEIDGVDAVDEDDLRAGLATQEDAGWRAEPFMRRIPVLGTEPSYFNKIAWERDRQRIVNFYYARGYFDAQIVSENLSRGQPGEVQVSIDIKEGEPTRIKTLTIEGMGAVNLNPDEALRGIAIKEGDIFTQRDYLAARETLERALRERSYAYAEVRGKVFVRAKDHTAEIVYFVDPGPRAVFGEVEIRGLEDVDEEYVRQAVVIEEGEYFSSKAIQDTQEFIYNLGVFSLVTVQPAYEFDESASSASTDDDTLPSLSGGPPTPAERNTKEANPRRPSALNISDIIAQAKTDAERRANLPRKVKIVVKVNEAKNWSGRIGAGFSLNSTRQDVHAAFNIRSRNFFGTLGKLEQFNTVGYALTPGIFDAQLRGEQGLPSWDDFGNKGVFFDSELRYTQPQLIGAKTSGFLRGKVRREIQENYIALVPSSSVGLRRPLLSRRITGEVSYNILFIYYQQFDDSFGDELAEQGLNPAEANPSLLLEYLEQSIIYDGRDNPINPTSGWRLQVSMQEARDYLFGGEYTYLKPRIRAEGYLPLGRSLVTAGRIGAGSIYNLSDRNESVPVQSRFFGGGRNSIRSFAPRYFGFFTNDPDNPTPIGALSLVEASVEQRVRLVRQLLDVGDFWGALYYDTGTYFDRQLFFDSASDTEGAVAFEDIRGSFIHGLGAGVYWLTPVGPVRADIAFTLTDLQQDSRYRDRPNSDALFDKIRTFDFYLGIGHSF